MEPDKLTTKERAALLALMAVAQEISNPELEERVGFRLDGKERLRLNDMKLVESRRLGRSFVHELTDAGWRRSAEVFAAGVPSVRPSALERALLAVLAQLHRHLTRADLRLHNVFVPDGAATPIEPAHPSDPSDPSNVEARVLAGYRAMAREPGEFVKLSGLRERLADVGRVDLDIALDRMYQEQQINLIPQSEQRALTTNDRASALRLGGEDKHLISIETP